MINHDQVFYVDILSTIKEVQKQSLKSKLENATKLLNAINAYLVFCLKNLLRGDRIKVYLTDVPAVWRESKKLVEEILAIFPERDILKRLEVMNLGFSSDLIDYLVWCFQNIITKDNKVKISLIKIIPFIIKSIRLVRKITDFYKKKDL